MASFVLVHSPLVGPTTWRWVADELGADGGDVAVPAISEVSLWSGWSAVVSEVARQVRGTRRAVFVAHSGAGPLLPSIVVQSGAIDPTLVFVDAGVPPESGVAPLMPSELLEQLNALARDGQLPPWSEWFGPHMMQELIPNEMRRATVMSELPRLRIEYFAASVPAVSPWPAVKNGYVLLSEAYLDDAEEARRRGWAVVEELGQHLDIVARPRIVADAINRCVNGG